MASEKRVEIRFEIEGIGWVYKDSMGYQNHVKTLDPAQTLPKINREDLFDKPYKPFGRMDDYSRLGVAAIVFAMKDAGIEQENDLKSAIIASTVTGCLETDIRYQATLTQEKRLPSPALFAYTLPNCFLGEAAILYGLTGESFVVSEETTCGMTGLGMAADLITAGDVSSVLCGVSNSDMQVMTDTSDPVRAGSLFILMSEYSGASQGRYGSLVRSGTQFYYDNEPVESLYDLADKCLTGNR